MIKITPDEIKLFSEYIYKISGIALDDKKAYLLETRLGSLIQSEGFSSYAELYRKAQVDSSKAFERKIIDAVTTNETMFFRDKFPFELFQHKIIPDLIDKKSSTSTGIMPIGIRIWSAACSTGQEVYSIAMVLKELFLDPPKYNVKLLGTDISDDAVKQASYGHYNRFEVERGLDRDMIDKYFSRDNSSWKIRDDIRAMVAFQKVNLMDNINSIGNFDIIFCRNVAIYFSIEDRKKLFNKIAQLLNPGGYLIIGATESLTGICPRFEAKRYLRSVFYQLKPG